MLCPMKIQLLSLIGRIHKQLSSKLFVTDSTIQLDCMELNRIQHWPSMSCQASVHPLSILNRITYHYQIQMATMYAFADAGSTAIEKGRAAVLAQYCAFAGQLRK